jgi:hypothetical protein
MLKKAVEKCAMSQPVSSCTTVLFGGNPYPCLCIPSLNATLMVSNKAKTP